MKANLRQPGNTTNISDDYPTHLRWGSLGGDDLTDPYGTPVHAQLDNAQVTIVDNSPDGSGGRYSRVTGPDGDSVESLHQSSVTAARGQNVNADTVIGLSGASAFGSNYGTGGLSRRADVIKASDLPGVAAVTEDGPLDSLGARFGFLLAGTATLETDASKNVSEKPYPAFSVTATARVEFVCHALSS